MEGKNKRGIAGMNNRNYYKVSMNLLLEEPRGMFAGIFVLAKVVAVATILGSVYYYRKGDVKKAAMIGAVPFAWFITGPTALTVRDMMSDKTNRESKMNKN